jgi:hypothetical protein
MHKSKSGRCSLVCDFSVEFEFSKLSFKIYFGVSKFTLEFLIEICSFGPWETIYVKYVTIVINNKSHFAIFPVAGSREKYNNSCCYFPLLLCQLQFEGLFPGMEAAVLGPPAPLQVQNIRAAYAELGRRVNIALRTQIGDGNRLGVQRVECFEMLQYVDQVCSCCGLLLVLYAQPMP